MEIFTVGFTRTSAEGFFERLRSCSIERLLDVRLNNRSQLAGFAKRDDLAYLLRRPCSSFPPGPRASSSAPGRC